MGSVEINDSFLDFSDYLKMVVIESIKQDVDHNMIWRGDLGVGMN